MFFRMENEFEGIDTSRVRFAITPNFRFDSVKKEVEWGPHKAETEQRMYAFATNSWLISEERTLKILVEGEVVAGMPAKKWAVFYRNDNGSIYWEHEGKKLVRAALFGDRALTWRNPRKQFISLLKQLFYLCRRQIATGRLFRD